MPRIFSFVKWKNIGIQIKIFPSKKLENRVTLGHSSYLAVTFFLNYNLFKRLV